MDWDYVLSGGGLAGTLLAVELGRRGRRVLVYDAESADAAWRVAPGIVNPLAGRRFHPAWKVAEQLPYAKRYYAGWQAAIGRPCFHEWPLYRFFRQPGEALLWEKRAGQASAAPYVGRRLAPDSGPGLMHRELGGFEAPGAWLEVRTFLEAIRLAPGSNIVWRFESLDSAALQAEPAGVRGPDWRAGTVVFCEGWAGRHNRWFGSLPFKPAKGEMVELQLPGEALPRAIFNRGKWLVSLGNGRAMAGATYGWDRLDGEPTAQGRAALEAGLAELLAGPWTIVNQMAGVRPILRDYRAVLGRHPRHPRLAIFNGLGSKGVLAGPWLADRLADHLESGAPLDPEITVDRFASLLDK